MFGASLPDDDYGREVLYEILNQLALRRASTDEMRALAIDLMPEIDDDDSLDTMVKRIGNGRKRGADQIARMLRVTYKMRTFLDLRSVGACDVSKKWRDAIQQQKEAADKRWKREKAGAKPHAKSAAKTKPWLELDCSEATYYRRRKAKKSAAENTKNSPCERFGDHTLSDVLMDKSPSGERRHRAGDHVPDHPLAGAGTTDQEEHGVEASTIIAKPLPSPSQPEPESVVSEEPASYGAVFSDALRAAHHEHFRLSGISPLSPEQKARLVELKGIIEAEQERRALLRQIKIQNSRSEHEGAAEECANSLGHGEYLPN